MDEPLRENHEFVVDCCRYAEGILTEQQVKKKYHFDDATWLALGEDDRLIEAIEAEKVRRVRNGAVARERSQVLFAETPDVLGKILHSNDVSPRHVIEAAREIRTAASVGPDAAPAEDRIVIEINLGNDERITIEGEPRKPNPNDSIIDVTPQKALEDDRKR